MDKLLGTSIQYLKGIGPKRTKYFQKLGILTIEDLLYYFPRRYEDRTNLLHISQLKEGQYQTIRARVVTKGEKQSWRRRSFRITEAVVGDDTGNIYCVWFNQPYIKTYLETGTTLILYGKVDRYSGRLQMNSPEFEVISAEGDGKLSAGKMVPVYALPESLTQRAFRLMIKGALDEYLPKLHDFLPFDVRQRSNLLNLARSLLGIHFPEGPDMQKQAYERLSFEEFFLFQLPLALRKSRKKEKPGIAHRIEGDLVSGFIDSLPFKFTPDQEKVIGEIKSDMSKPSAMQRLLQGDVGSGKTVVATVSGLIAIQGGHQAAFMVPTEILARQHFDKISSQVSAAGSQCRKVRVVLLTGSLTREEKRTAYREIKDGAADLIIGTQALLEEDTEFKDIGLVVIDEQHKFGVGQRALLPRKGVNPDVLIMTATPIPRTLAITLYADLDISVIKELPPGRLPIKTILLDKDRESEGYDILKEELDKGRQAYIIYPVIEESYALDIAGAKKMYGQLKEGALKGYRLGLIHGRLKQDEQDLAMRQFKEGRLDALIATTVLEVGIDVPNATCMVIQHAERFGLAQLHQLRGRIGRGAGESRCILISGAQAPEAQKRLEAMVKYSDGFRISEEDLKIRGPGEFFGRRQHGLTELKIANPLTQLQLLKKAKEEAASLIAKDPGLKDRQNLLLRDELLSRFPEYDSLIMVG